MASRIVAISGGVGGAKLSLGLARVLDPDQLAIVANTGDDFDHLGLRICPDLDTVMYTLADVNNKELGWGQVGETWQFLDALEKLGGETWFRLGDRDLATHIQRTTLLRSGQRLSAVTASLCAQLGVEVPLLPMTDDDVRTMVFTQSGETLSFQHYFVRDRCAPRVSGFEFAGIETAAPAPGFISRLTDIELGAVIICPSNPFVSVDPVLALPGVLEAMQNSSAPVIAVSPIIGGEAIKGPAAKMMAELGMPITAAGVAEHYADRIDGFVLDHRDVQMQSQIEALGLKVLVTETLMRSLEDREALAKAVLGFVEGWRTRQV